MIDIEKAKKEFGYYARNYDMENENIDRKYYHTFRVMDIAGEIAKSLQLSEEEVNLAKIVGLLHDIARFEQYTRFRTFSDIKSIDHGDFGAEILKQNDFIRKFVETDQYDNIILKSVKNHNKYKVEEDLTDQELLYTRIVRDADKIDIYFEILTMFYKNPDDVESLENEIIDESTVELILKYESIKRKKNENAMEEFIVMLCLIFDLNFKYSFEIMQKEDYINKIINRFDFKKTETKEKIERIRDVLNNYIQTKKG